MAAKLPNIYAIDVSLTWFCVLYFTITCFKKINVPPLPTSNDEFAVYLILMHNVNWSNSKKQCYRQT